MTIKTKILLSSAISAALIWGVGTYATNVGENSLSSAINASTLARARAIMDEIDYTMNIRVADWRAYIRTTLVQETLAASNKSFDELADVEQAIARRDDQWNSPIDGEYHLIRELLNNELANELKIRVAELSKGSGFPVYGEVFLTNRYGAIVAMSGCTSDYRQDDEEWWLAAVQAGVYFGDINYDSSSDTYATDICLRIDDQEGNFIGVLKAVLSIQEAVAAIDRVADDSPTGAPIQLALFSSEQKLIHSTDRSLSEWSRDRSFLTDDEVANFQEITDPTGDTEKQLLVTTVKSLGFGEFEGFDWVLLVSQSADAVFHPVRQLRRYIVTMASVATAALLLLGAGFAFSISDRLGQLRQLTGEVGRGNLDVVVEVSGEDEVSWLSRSFNQMAVELKQANLKLINQARDLEFNNQQLKTEISQREQAEIERQVLNERLIESSRLAGKAEVATGILHNVGNVLNSVNVSVNLLIDEVSNSQVELLGKTSDLIELQTDLATFVTEDERGRHLPRLLKSLAGNLSNKRKSQLEELKNLANNVEHIKEIVNMQQSYARQHGVAEIIDPTELIERAVKINESLLGRGNVQLVRNFDSVRKINIEKHRIIQIIVNLLRNACQATEQNEDSGCRTVEVRLSEEADFVRIDVQDNGIGIPAENLNKVFSQGFTTKHDGHGFGLHSCALAAQEAGGTLSVASEGVGKGATFTLRLPLNKEMVCSA